MFVFICATGIDAGGAVCREFCVRPKDTTTIRVLRTRPPLGLPRGVIGNDQRQDVTPLEPARSYRAPMDATGWTVEELGARIGKAPHRIFERTALLNLRPEYQALLASGNLKPSEATELVRLSPRGQDTMFNAIRTGGWRNDCDLRASSTALVNAEAQLLLMQDAPPPPTKEDRELANAFAAHVERVAALLRSGIRENQIVAVRKTSQHRAGTLADLLAVMQTGPAPHRGRAARGRHPGEFPRPSRLTRRRSAGARGPYLAAPYPPPEFAPGRTTPMHGPGGRGRADRNPTPPGGGHLQCANARSGHRSPQTDRPTR